MFLLTGLAQPPMYMMPTHRPMFPGQPGVAAPPGYMPIAPPPQQMMTMPELTVKTSQGQVASSTQQHASTSPNKPLSAASSPKVR